MRASKILIVVSTGIFRQRLAVKFSQTSNSVFSIMTLKAANSQQTMGLMHIRAASRDAVFVASSAQSRFSPIAVVRSCTA